MPLHKLSLTLLIALAACGARAEEEAGKAAGPVIPKDQREYNEKTARLTSLGSRIEEDEKEFHELVERKEAEKSPEEKDRIIKQMVEVTKARNKDADEYMKIKSDLTLRYPNQGEHLERSYQTQSRKSVEELEGAAGLDELLTRTKKVIEQKYAAFEDPEAKKKPVVKVAPATVDGEEPKKLRLEK